MEYAEEAKNQLMLKEKEIDELRDESAFLRE